MKKRIIAFGMFMLMAVCLMSGCKSEREMKIMGAKMNTACVSYHARFQNGEIMKDVYPNVIERYNAANKATVKEALEYFDMGDTVGEITKMNADSNGFIFYPSDDRYTTDEAKTELLHREGGSTTLGAL